MTRDEQGRQVATTEETTDALGMTITDGGTYWFQGSAYRATLEETSSDTMVSFQRLPINQVDDEPSLFLDREGTLSDDTGTFLGSYDELEEGGADAVTADDVRELLTSTSMEPTMVRWLDTGEVETVAGVLFSDISYSNRGREYQIIATAADLREQGDWDTDNPTAEDFEAFAQQLNESNR
jgi:hypothetical protein